MISGSPVHNTLSPSEWLCNMPLSLRRGRSQGANKVSRPGLIAIAPAAGQLEPAYPVWSSLTDPAIRSGSPTDDRS